MSRGGPETARVRGPRRRRRILVATVAGLAVLGLGVACMPRPPQLGAASGDPALTAQAVALLDNEPGARGRISIAVVEGVVAGAPERGAVRFADFGADPETEYEIGSVTKTMTAALLAEAVARDEVSLDTELGALLDLGNSPAAGVSLEELATHTSGLPRLALTPGTILGSIVANYRASNPYSEDLPQLLDQARGSALTDPGAVAYSNLGVALLGHALAAAAGTDYATLLRERVFVPLRLDDTRLPETAAELGPDAPHGYTRGGRAAEPWVLHAYSPAGGVRSTSADLARYAAALLAGTAPGATALEPLRDDGDGGQVGLAWFRTAEGVTWHNGGTGGFMSYVGLDRERGSAVVVLSNTAVSVDALGAGLLNQLGADEPELAERNSQ